MFTKLEAEWSWKGLKLGRNLIIVREAANKTAELIKNTKLIKLML
jgi:hypothetical protein